METYDVIGNDYNRTRNADMRIVEKITALLECIPESIIADIGAGTGNYTQELAQKNYSVYAIEPSGNMIKQGVSHEKIKWVQGYAENIPLEQESVSGVICILAVHHFYSIQSFLHESYQILKKNGKLVVFTFDPRIVSENDWLRDYFNDFYEKALLSVPSQDSMCKIVRDVFRSIPKVTHFSLPADLTDSFFYSGWRNPEQYLDRAFRNGISVFAGAEPCEVEIAVKRLHVDLQNGIWEDKYGRIRNLQEYNAGYYFLSINKHVLDDM